MMTPDKIQALIAAQLTNAQIDIDGDDGVHFSARIVAPQFSGLNQLARHRMVYACLGDAMDQAIHALSLQTFAPEEL